MARKSKSERLSDIHAAALRSFALSHSATQDQREASLSDRRFHTVAGAQWAGAVGQQFENRIKLESDKVHRPVKRALTEFRESRVTVRFVSKDGEASDGLADTCQGMFRADSQDSQAEEAFDNAFEEGVGGGFGAWRLTTEYEDEYDDEDDRQRICLEPIYEADQSVYFDPNAKRYDKSDAAFAFIVTPMTPEAFEEEWGESPASWPADFSDQWGGFEWSAPDAVFVAEYFAVEEGRRTIVRYEGPTGEKEKYDSEDLTDEIESELAARGFVLAGEKTIRVRQVHKYIMSGGGVLEDCGIIAGNCIPIVPFYGERAFVEGSEHWMGLVRKAKDMQTLKNMQLSMLAGISATGGLDTPVFAPEQIQGHEQAWARSAVDNPAYLLANPLEDAQGNIVAMGQIGVKSAPQIPQAMAALLQISDADISDILGNQDQGDEYSSNLSGVAVELVQTRLDRQVYLYMSNFAKSMKYCGRVWLGMARDIYVEDGRRVKMVDDNDGADYAAINTMMRDDEEGLVPRNRISDATFDVAVDVGATSSSARSATVRTLSALLPMVGDPVDQSVILATMGRNIEGEGVSGMNEYFRKKLVQLGVEGPNDEDKREAQEAAEAQQQQPVDPQTQYLMAEAQRSQANAAKAEADTAKALADTELARAKTAETLAGINIDQRNAALNAAEKLSAAVSVPPLNDNGAS